MNENINIEYYQELIKPKILKKQLPNSNILFRDEIMDILNDNDNRLLVIVGPCSIHNTNEALEYAKKLSELREKFIDKLFIIMRVYFEKPRTTIGWKGLINDPDLDNTCNINKGLYISRELMINISKLNLPIGCEFLDTISPKFICDLVSWGAIGARTTESQCHRQLASGLSMPIGFKNSTNGNINKAIDAIISCKYEHTFLGINQDNNSSIIKTRGNKYGHIILRGGDNMTNYDEKSVYNCYTSMKTKNIKPNIIIDCSHGNSQKDYKKQPLVIENICSQLKKNKKYIKGVMIESNINEGNQNISNNLKYGVSVTDSCVSLETTEELLQNLYNSL
jgi:3-deoxy-7-phosphoheptulonate synthase